MARFKVEIFKRLGNENWGNRYFVETISFTTARPLAEQIWLAEASFHSDQVFFYNARISTVIENDNLFVSIPLAFNGLLSGAATGGLLPLWNVCKAYLGKDLQRPDYKLYRGVLGENNSENGTVAAATRDIIRTALETLAVDDPQVIFPESGPAYVEVDVDLFIRQRDLHRRRRTNSAGTLQTPA